MRSYLRVEILLFIVILSISTYANQQLPDKIKRMEDSLLYEIVLTKNDALKVDLLYELSSNIFRYDYLKGLRYINRSIKIAEEIEDLNGIIWGYYLKGSILNDIDDHEESIEAFFKAELLNKELNSDTLYGRIYNCLGNMYADIDDKKKAIFYLKLSNEYSMKISDNYGIANSLNDLGYALSSWGEYDSALPYFEEALEYRSLNDHTRLANLYLNIINVYLKDKHDPDKISLVLQKLIDLEEKIFDLQILGELYYMYGSYYKYINEEDKAVLYFKKSIELCETSKYWEMMSLAADELVNINIKEENCCLAYKFRELVLLAKDSLNIDNLRMNITKYELKNSYENHLAQMEIESQKSKFNRLLYGIVISLVIIVLGVLYYLSRKETIKRRHDTQIKQKLYEAELKNSSLEQIRLRDELKFKNNELMNFALQIVQKNDFIKNVFQKIKKLKINLKREGNIKQIDKITLFINQSFDITKARKEFYMNINMLNKAFFHNLNQKFPDLTNNEKRLALLLRLDFSSKQIATLLNVSIHAVESSRYRLRKKLDIDTKTNLPEFFNTI